MKRSVSGLLVLVSLLLLPLLMVFSGSTCAAARPFRRDQADEALWVDMSDNKTMKHPATTLAANEEDYSFSSGMGGMEDEEHQEEEGCTSEEEEECRRMMTEAHLDYIYTQHHPHH